MYPPTSISPLSVPEVCWLLVHSKLYTHFHFVIFSLHPINRATFSRISVSECFVMHENTHLKCTPVVRSEMLSLFCAPPLFEHHSERVLLLGSHHWGQFICLLCKECVINSISEGLDVFLEASHSQLKSHYIILLLLILCCCSYRMKCILWVRSSYELYICILYQNHSHSAVGTRGPVGWHHH